MPVLMAATANDKNVSQSEKENDDLEKRLERIRESRERIREIRDDLHKVLESETEYRKITTGLFGRTCIYGGWIKVETT